MRLRRLLGLAAVVVLLAVPVWALLFVHSQAAMVVAGHDSVVRPTFDHHVRLETGPYLPDLRVRSSGAVGVRIAVGKTTTQSTNELIQRYALIAGHPEIETRAVTREVKSLAFDAALRALLLASVPVLGWELLGSERRAQLRRPGRRGMAVAVVFVLFAGFVAWQPWRPALPRVAAGGWVALPDAVPELTVPPELADVEVQGDVFTQDTRKLIADAFDYYDRSTVFYKRLVAQAPAYGTQLREPEEGDTVAVLVSDRHDNIGMDDVVRAVADAGGATAVIDAGDDTSAGQEWEAFSLESLDKTFDDYDDRIAITGNHDYGGFVGGYLRKRGWTRLDHRATEKFGVRFYGVDDPRSSGLGAFNEVKGPTFEEEKAALADEVCELDESDERISTVIVHDANMAATALARGCVDLVLSGHTHVQVGPERIIGENGSIGYRYTNGTTGGAAFAVAVGGKLRREAEFTFVTFRDGRPIGLQPVRIDTRGDITVDPFITLDLGAAVSESQQGD